MGGDDGGGDGAVVSKMTTGRLIHFKDHMELGASKLVGGGSVADVNDYSLGLDDDHMIGECPGLEVVEGALDGEVVGRAVASANTNWRVVDAHLSKRCIHQGIIYT